MERSLAEKTVEDDEHSTCQAGSRSSGKFISDKQPANHIGLSMKGVQTK